MPIRAPRSRQQQGVVTRGVLEDALKKKEQELVTGQVQLPAKGAPTGTGFRHMTNGVEDPAAKLVDTADVNDDQITYAKMQNVSAASRLLGRGDSGAGSPEELTLDSSLEIVGTQLRTTAVATDFDVLLVDPLTMTLTIDPVSLNVLRA